MTRRRLAGLGLAVAAAGGAVVPVGPVPLVPLSPAAAADPPCAELRADTPVTAADPSLSAPAAALRIAEAHDWLRRRGLPLGGGVRVAVLDSGVGPRVPMAVDRRPGVTGSVEVEDFHGTAVAGLIAAPYREGRPVGIAPEAEIVDIRVYDTPTPTGADQQGASAAGLAAGLREVLRLGDVDIVNVSLRVPADPEVERLVDQLWRRGTVVVAAAGNRPEGGEEDDALAAFAEPRPGQDAAGVVFPAGYPRTVAVSATTDGLAGEPASRYVLPSSATDVAAPVHGAVSVGLNGAPCLLTDVATSWSAAQVSGVLALLKAAYDEEPAALVARLVSTADGRGDVRSPYTGAGVVQPLAALQRPVRPGADGAVASTEVEREDRQVSVPARDEDPLAGAGREAVWWGLLGGGAVVLALVLRPLLSRRRP